MDDGAELNFRSSPEELRDLIGAVHRALLPALATLQAPYGPLQCGQIADGSFAVRGANGREVTFRIDSTIGAVRLSETVASVGGSMVDRIYAVHYMSGGEPTFAFRRETGPHPSLPTFTGLVLPYFVEAVAATIDPSVRAPRDFGTARW